jgi:hypothetical protein
MKVVLRFPLHKMLVEVLKTFEIYLHQLTPEALIKVGGFYMGYEESGTRARCLVLLQYPQVILLDKGNRKRTIP